MKKNIINLLTILLVWFSSFLINFNTVEAAWQKQAVYEGKITAFHYTVYSDGSGYHYTYYVGTAGAGIFKSTNGTTWTAVNTGLEDDLTIIGIASRPSVVNTLYLITKRYVYISTTPSVSWNKMQTQISDSYGHPARLTCITVATCGTSSNDFIYVGTFGNGIWRHGYADTLVNWQQNTNDNMQDNLRILSIAAVDSVVMAGTEYVTTDTNSGKIYRCGDCSDNSWYDYSGAGLPQTSWLSLAGHKDNFGTALFLAGSDDQGIYSDYETGISAFVPYCNNSSPPAVSFQSIDFSFDTSDSFYGLTGTNDGLYELLDDPRNCTSSSSNYYHSDYYGNLSEVSHPEDIGDTSPPNNAFIGTSGKGLFLYDLTNISMTNVSQNQIQNQQVNQIIFSSQFNTDGTMFIASRSEGVYKSKNSGVTFTRFFCHPEAFGPVDILSIAATPSYNEFSKVKQNIVGASVVYTQTKTIIVGTNGNGVLMSRDGGASWNDANGGNSNARGVITDVGFSPNVHSDKTIFASNWVTGLFQSEDMGSSWSLVTQCSLATLSHIHRFAIAPNYAINTNEIIYLATQKGVFRHDASNPDNCTNCVALCNKNVNRIETRYYTKTQANDYRYFCMGTVSEGVWRKASTDGGSTWRSWQMTDSLIGTTAHVIDVAVSPDIIQDSPNYYYLVYVIIYDTNSKKTKIYYTKDYMEQLSAPSCFWTLVTGPTPIVPYYQTVTFHPFFDGTTEKEIFVGHFYKGMFYGNHDTSGTACNASEPSTISWTSSTGYYALPPEVTATAIDPADPNIVFYGTRDMGMFISYDGGQSACPFGRDMLVEDPSIADDLYSAYDITSIAISDSFSTVFFDDFENRNKWTFSTDGEWEYGPPLGLGGSYGNPDPSTAYSGSNVIGNDLTGLGSYQGDYEPSITSSFAQSPAIDCTYINNSELSFERWLNVESYVYDQVKIEGSSNGTTWNDIWTSTSSINDSSWTPITTDISAYADFRPTFYIRFTLSSDTSYQYSGWNIDDVKITGLGDPSGTRHLIVGTETPSDQSFLGAGVFYTSYSSRETARDISWQWSTSTDTDAIQTSDITELSYSSVTNEDMWASILVGSRPAYHSSDFGETWVPTTSNTNGAMFTGIKINQSASKKGNQSKNSPPQPPLKADKGISQTLWAASGGSKTPFKKVADCRLKAKIAIAGAYNYDSSSDSWILANGTSPFDLSTDIYYDAILQSAYDMSGETPIFIAGWDVSNTDMSGVWRTNDDGVSWYLSSAGLTTSALKKVSCFLEIPDFSGRILIGVKDPAEGGVFMSDNSGYAWLRIDDFVLADKSVQGLSIQKSDIPGDTTVYASLVSDGSMKVVDLQFPAGSKPIPEFIMNDSNRTLADYRYPDEVDKDNWAQCNTDTFVYFSSKSAGVSGYTDESDVYHDIITNYDWDFDYDGTTFTPEASVTGNSDPTWQFSSGGIKRVALRLNGDNTLIVSHKIYVTDTHPPPIPDGDIISGAQMTVSKNAGSDTQLVVNWDDSCKPVAANILYGSLDAIDPLRPYIITGSECSITQNHVWDIGTTTNIWFFIVSENDKDPSAIQGSWGVDSDGTERDDVLTQDQCGCTSKDTNGTCP